jgi:predicted amidohydrolase YtcJ
LDVDLRAVDGAEALAASVARAALTIAAPHWIRGWGWDGIAAPATDTPTHPVFLARRDGHGAFINPAGRAALGLSPDDAIVSEEAFDAVRKRLPSRGTSERMGALRPHLSELVAFGIETVDDMVEPWAGDVYARLRDAKELPVAIGLWLPEAIAESDAEALLRELPGDDPRLAVRGIKIFLDGTLGARTAALSSPYADDPETSGELRIAPAEIEARVARWATRGWPIALHAIGDRAVSSALTALERVPHPRFGAHRIEHAQVVLRSDLPRFAAAGIVASVQPGHWRDDAPFLAARLGERPEVVSHPLASLVRSGAHVLFGSDWPVSSWDPASILSAATDGGRGDEALDAAEASAWYTSGPR